MHREINVGCKVISKIIHIGTINIKLGRFRRLGLNTRLSYVRNASKNVTSSNCIMNYRNVLQHVGEPKEFTVNVRAWATTMALDTLKDVGTKLMKL